MEGDVGWNHRTPRSTQGDAVLLPLVTRRIRPNRVHADLQLLLHLSFPFSLPFRPFPLFDLFSLLSSAPAWGLARAIFSKRALFGSAKIQVKLILICSQDFVQDKFSYFFRTF